MTTTDISSSSPAESVAQPTANQPEPLAYPESPREDIADELHGQRIADPYRWLEDPANPRVQEWMTAQDTLTRAYLGKLTTRAELAKRLAELSYYDAVYPPNKRGTRYFYARKHADKEKMVMYWKEGEDGAEKVLIDPNTLSDDGSVSLGGMWPSYDGRYVAYKLKKNNADAATMFVMEVATGKTSDIDVIDGAKYATASWTPDNKGFYYTKLPEDPSIPISELPGYAHVRYHALGTKSDADPEIFPASRDPRMFVNANVSRDGRYLFVTVQHGWNSTDVYVKDLAKKPAKKPANAARAQAKAQPPAWQALGFDKLVAGEPAIFDVKEWKGSFYVLTNYQAPRYRVFKVDPKRMAMSQWREIVPQSNTAVIESMDIIGNHLTLGYLENAYSRLEIRNLDGASVRQVELPGIGSVSGMIGNEDEDDAYFIFSSFTKPTQIFRSSISTGATALWSSVELRLPPNIVVEQVRYPSKDGTQISMFIVRRADLQPNGKHPVLLYGYGGFNINLTPAFRTDAVVWAERGGIFAIANLRGGGEYGEEWHKAGMLLNKQNVFDDFIYAANYLLGSGWTNPKQLAIYGGSNGGLLVGAAMTQAPELFGAVVCAVPLLDMVRYHQFGSGKTWIPEYGSAEDPEQFKVLAGYSPYHRVVKDTQYPALLMLSADSDDRVDPMHARKFVAAVQWAQKDAVKATEPVLLRIERNAGHGGADLVKQRVEQQADMLAFLLDQLAAK